MLAHRRLAEQALGRPLLPREIVHHLDGDSLNNSPENLVVLPSQRVHAHAEFHLRRAKSGMPSLFPELFQFFPPEAQGTLFARVLAWKGQEPPPPRRGVHAETTPTVDVALPPLLPLDCPSYERRLELVLPEKEAGVAALRDILAQFLVRSTCIVSGQVRITALAEYIP